MKDRLVPAQGGSANFGDSRVTVTLGTASGGRLAFSPAWGWRGPPGRTCGGGDGGDGGAGGRLRSSPCSLCPGKCLRRRQGSGRWGRSSEVQTGVRVPRPVEYPASPGAGPNTASRLLAA